MKKLCQGYSYLVKQVSMGYNPICVFVGRIRVGKSWMACGTALHLQPYLDGTDWDVEKQLFVDFDKFLKALDESEKKVLIFDEAGYSLGSKEWYSKMNKGMGKILQTQGYRSNIIILILPMIIQLAKDHRRMVDLLFHVKKRGYSDVILVRRNYTELYNDTFKMIRLNPIMYKPIPDHYPVLKSYDSVLEKLKRKIPKNVEESSKKKKKKAPEVINSIIPDCNV